MVGSNNSHCQIFEFVSRAKCELIRVALPRETGEKRSGGGVKTIDQQSEAQEEKLKIGSKDNDAKKAAAFLREIRPLFDDDGRRTVDRLKQIVERGTHNQLADALNRISKKQKKEPLPSLKILEQLEELDKRYSQPQTPTATKQVALTTADIILSETFI